MNLLLLLIGIGFQIGISLSESGDCENKENVPGRNLIHNGSLEVDPCVPLIFKKCVKPEVENCSATLINTEETPYDFILGEYEIKTKSVKFALILPFSTEFWIVAHASDAEGNVESTAENLGYFVDNVFPFCNSFACCDPLIKGKTNVARRCPDANNAPTKIPDKPGFYGLTYIFYPPKGFSGDFVFVAVFSDSEGVHYADVRSNPIHINATEKPITHTDPQPKPINTTDKPNVPPPVTDRPNITVQITPPTANVSAESKKIPTPLPQLTMVATTVASVPKLNTNAPNSVIAITPTPQHKPKKKKKKTTTTLRPLSVTVKVKKRKKKTTAKPKPKQKKPQSEEDAATSEEESESEEDEETPKHHKHPSHKKKSNDKEGKKSTPASPEDGLKYQVKQKPKKKFKNFLFGLR